MTQKTAFPVLQSLVALIVAVLLTTCANPVSPSGGPKDETPPAFLKAEPPLLTRNFQARKVRIYFDEFLQFKELNQQVIISPPVEEQPEFKLKGKSVQIEFKEELKDSTTYNIFFGNAIVDLTENNPISNFQYVFSTGNILDSMTLKGNVRDAFNLEPVKDLNVMLYLDINDTIPFDSIPYFSKPYYYSKTAENGDFQFNNLRNEDFKIFVLEDANSNMLFDQVTERIAFVDSLVRPYYIPPPPPPDTMMVDDSLIIAPPPPTYEPEPLEMFLFQEKDSVQRFIKASLVKSGKAMFVFKESTTAPEIRPLGLKDTTDWVLTETNLTRDTISLWFKKDVPDTITFVVSDNGEVFDTLDLSTVEKSRGRRERRRDKEEEVVKLIAKFGKKTELNKAQRIVFNYPIRDYNLEGSLLVENEDTLVPQFGFIDSIRLVGEFRHEWLENASYFFLIPDSAFFGLGGQSHDTLTHKMRTKAVSDYGNLFINAIVPEPGQNYMVQLLKEDKVVGQEIVTEDSEIAFKFLLPGNYRVKVIFDKNGNETWDTGHYLTGQQPEPVYYFPAEITIRANWDIVEDWAF
jgi:hypothetical protein